jgi:hypothetical protein
MATQRTTFLSHHLLLDHWLLLPAACSAIILLSILYTHGRHRSAQKDDAATYRLLQDLASMQITGVLLVSAAVAAVRGANKGPRPLAATAQQHPMLPQAAARKRQQMPLV